MKKNNEWFQNLKYGIDGPAPYVDGPRDGKEYDEVIAQWDVKKMAKVAVEAGADYVQLNVGQIR